MPMPMSDFREWYSGWYRENKLSGDFKPDKPSIHKKEPGPPDLTPESVEWEDVEPRDEDAPEVEGDAWRWS